MNTADKLKIQTEIASLQSRASSARAALAAAGDASQRFEQQILLRGLGDRIAALTRNLNG